MAVVAFLVFASALAASVAVFWLTLAPALPRIVALLRDGIDPAASHPVSVVSEPRLCERIRLVSVSTAPRWREAA